MNIPIYRAKKKDSDEDIIGQYLPTYKTERNEDGDNIDEDEVLHHYLIKSISNAETDDEDRFDFWGFEEIDITTLAIHFPSWVANDEDYNDIKAFASFNKNKIGGDIVEVRDNFVGISGVLHLNENHELCIDDCRITNFDLSQMQVTGVQK